MPSLPSPRGKSRPRLEIIPFIDVMFFLLATFMMVSLSMIKNEGVSVNLPKAVTSAPDDRKTSVTVTISESGDVYLGKERIAPSELRGRLQNLKAGDPDLKVLINGDEHAYFGQAVEALDEIRSLGITKVSIQTKAKK